MFLNSTVTMVESSPLVKWSGLQTEWGINVTQDSDFVALMSRKGPEIGKGMLDFVRILLSSNTF